MTLAEDILQRQMDLERDRGNWNTLWQEAGYYVLPREAQFTMMSAQAQKRTERLFDFTAVTGCERFASVCDSMLTPHTQRWHKLKSPDEDLADDHEVQLYFDRLTNLLFAQRYSAKANFASQVYEAYMSLGAFGNMCMYIDERPGGGMRYSARHLTEIYWTEDHQGNIDRIYRKFKLTARQYVGQFGDKASSEVQSQFRVKPDMPIEVIHCVQPNEGKGLPWASYYVDHKEQRVITESGYHTFPYAVGRYVVAPNEMYGRGPAQSCMPAIKTANEMQKTLLTYGQMSVAPPILLTEEGVLQGFSLKSAALNPGTMSDDGTPLAQAFQMNSKLEFGMEFLEKQHNVINDTFLVSLFQILIESPDAATATLALIKKQEKGELLSPTMGRQQSEFLGPMIQREIDILSRDPRNAWIVDEMPDSLRQTGMQYQIEYQSPLTDAQRAGQGAAITNTFQSAAIIAQVDPNALDVLDFDASLTELAKINGMPEKLLRSPEQIAVIRQQKQAQAETQQALENAPNVSQAALNIAKAQGIGNSQISAGR